MKKGYTKDYDFLKYSSSVFQDLNLSLRWLSLRIVLLPFVFVYFRVMWVNLRWKMHLRNLTHVENTSTWVNSHSIFQGNEQF